MISTVLSFMTLCQATSPNLPQRISVGDLTKQYEQSRADVRTKYDGEEIIVSGVVTIEGAMPENDKYEGVISLKEKDSDSSLKVDCWFNRKDAAELDRVKRDQYITVKGVFNGESGAILRFCKLVEVE